MKDLFYREQQVYDNAMDYADEIRGAELCSLERYQNIVDEYGKLLRQVRSVIRMSDKTTVRLNRSKLDLLSKVHYDALTGLYNRRFLDEKLRQVIKSLSVSNRSLTVLMIDIDYFKRYNDTYGHSAGDECLKSVAKAIEKGAARKDDFVARYGGEEFIAVLPDTDEGGAHIIAKKMLENVKACDILHEKNLAADCVTISVGASVGEVKHPQSSIEFVRYADAALYKSKENGRNRYTVVRVDKYSSSEEFFTLELE